jgi:hypothetical protein
MNLKEYISENWSKSDFIRVSLNYEIRNQIEQNTSFLNSYYSDIPLRTRAATLAPSRLRRLGASVSTI